MHESSHENDASQDMPAHEVATEGFPAVPEPTCGLAGGLYCALPLDGSAKSIKLHLRTHGHRHQQREVLRSARVETNVDSNIKDSLEGRLLGTRMPGASTATLGNDRLHKSFKVF